MKIKYIFTTLILFFSLTTFAQKERVYKKLSEASKEPNKVVILKLVGKRLKEFPVELKKFKNLEKLDVQLNSIQTIPSWISKLKKLKELNLYNLSLIHI